MTESKQYPTTTYLNTGYIFCPYIPIMACPTISIDPDNYVPRKNILTRYGKKILAEGAKYYQNAKHIIPDDAVTKGNEVNVIEED